MGYCRSLSRGKVRSWARKPSGGGRTLQNASVTSVAFSLPEIIESISLRAEYFSVMSSSFRVKRPHLRGISITFWAAFESQLGIYWAGSRHCGGMRAASLDCLRLAMALYAGSLMDDEVEVAITALKEWAEW